MPGEREESFDDSVSSLPFSLCLSLPFPSVIIFFFHMIGGFDVFLTSRNIITPKPIDNAGIIVAAAAPANYRSTGAKL